jgi:hypothetical protein
MSSATLLASKRDQMVLLCTLSYSCMTAIPAVSAATGLSILLSCLVTSLKSTLMAVDSHHGQRLMISMTTSTYRPGLITHMALNSNIGWWRRMVALPALLQAEMPALIFSQCMSESVGAWSPRSKPVHMARIQGLKRLLQLGRG